MDTTVFIGGSRKLSRLSTDVRRRIDNIIDSAFAILLGDANGADKAVQNYLLARNYQRVTVFCMTGKCRNNLGRWPVRAVDAPKEARGFGLYTLKDRAMADAATHGLMIWDGTSKGTLNNIVTMVQQQKPVVVYFGPMRGFVTIRTFRDVSALLAKCEQSSVERFQRELGLCLPVNPSAVEPH